MLWYNHDQCCGNVVPSRPIILKWVIKRDCLNNEIKRFAVSLWLIDASDRLSAAKRQQTVREVFVIHNDTSFQREHKRLSICQAVFNYIIPYLESLIDMTNVTEKIAPENKLNCARLTRPAISSYGFWWV